MISKSAAARKTNTHTQKKEKKKHFLFYRSALSCRANVRRRLEREPSFFSSQLDGQTSAPILSFLLLSMNSIPSCTAELTLFLCSLSFFFRREELVQVAQPELTCVLPFLSFSLCLSFYSAATSSFRNFFVCISKQQETLHSALEDKRTSCQAL